MRTRSKFRTKNRIGRRPVPVAVLLTVALLMAALLFLLLLAACGEHRPAEPAAVSASAPLEAAAAKSRH